MFLFHPPYKFRNIIGMYKGHLRLTGRPKRINFFLELFSLFFFFSFFSFKKPKRPKKMAAQSCTFSTDANTEKESNFQGQNPSV